MRGALPAASLTTIQLCGLRSPNPSAYDSVASVIALDDRSDKRCPLRPAHLLDSLSHHHPLPDAIAAARRPQLRYAERAAVCRLPTWTRLRVPEYVHPRTTLPFMALSSKFESRALWSPRISSRRGLPCPLGPTSCGRSRSDGWAAGCCSGLEGLPPAPTPAARRAPPDDASHRLHDPRAVVVYTGEGAERDPDRRGQTTCHSLARRTANTSTMRRCRTSCITTTPFRSSRSRVSASRGWRTSASWW